MLQMNFWFLLAIVIIWVTTFGIGAFAGKEYAEDETLWKDLYDQQEKLTYEYKEENRELRKKIEKLEKKLEKLSRKE